MRAELAGRPLLVAAIALICGISSAWYIGSTVFLLILCLAIGPKPAKLVWALGPFLLGVVVAPPPPLPHERITGLFEGTSQVVSVPRTTALGTSCLVDCAGSRWQLEVRGAADLNLGQKVYIRGKLSEVHGEYGRVLMYENVQGQISARQDSVVPLTSGWWIAALAKRLRDSYAGALSSAESTVEAIALGSSPRLSRGDRGEIVRAGAAHFLSASGLHVFLLAVVGLWLLGLMPIPRALSVGIVSVALLLFVFATGLQPAGIRASIMAVLAMSAYMFGREPDFLSGIGLAAIVTVLPQPWTIYSAGFQISFVTVLGLALFWEPPPWERQRGVLHRVANWAWFLFRSSILSTLAAGPIIAYHFGEVPLLTPITSLLLAPAVPLLLLCSMLAWICSLLGLGGFVAASLCAPLGSYVGLVSRVLSEPNWATLRIPPFEPWWLVPYYAAFVILWERRTRI